MSGRRSLRERLALVLIWIVLPVTALWAVALVIGLGWLVSGIMLGFD